MSDTIPQGGVPTPQNETQRKLDLDMKLEGFVAWRDRALVTWQRDIRKLLLRAESQNLTIGTTDEKKGATSARVYGDICHISYINFESL